MNISKTDRQVSSDIFKISHTKFALEMIGSYGKSVCFILITLTIIFSLLGIIFSDVRWAILAALVCLIIAPMILCFLYFNYGLREECYCNILNHNLEFSSEGLKVNILFSEKNTEEMVDGNANENIEGEKSKIITTFIPGKNIKSYSLINNAIKINIISKDRKNGFIIAPYKAFRNEDEFKDVIQFLLNYRA